MRKRMTAIIDHASTISRAILPTPAGTPMPDSYTGMTPFTTMPCACLSHHQEKQSDWLPSTQVQIGCPCIVCLYAQQWLQSGSCWDFSIWTATQQGSASAGHVLQQVRSAQSCLLHSNAQLDPDILGLLHHESWVLGRDTEGCSSCMGLPGGADNHAWPICGAARPAVSIRTVPDRCPDQRAVWHRWPSQLVKAGALAHAFS